MYARSVCVDQQRHIFPGTEVCTCRSGVEGGGRGGEGEGKGRPFIVLKASELVDQGWPCRSFTIRYEGAFQSLKYSSPPTPARVGTLRSYAQASQPSAGRVVLFPARLFSLRTPKCPPPPPHPTPRFVPNGSRYRTTHHPCFFFLPWFVCGKLADIRVRVHVEAAAYVRRQGAEPRSAHRLRRVAGKTSNSNRPSPLKSISRGVDVYYLIPLCPNNARGGLCVDIHY